MEFKPNNKIGAVIAPTPKNDNYSTEGLPIFQPGKAPVVIEQEIIDPRRGPVNQWSISTIFEFEKCPYSVFLSKVQKIPGKDSEAAARGSMLHLQGERFVMGEEQDAGVELDDQGVPYNFRKFKNGMIHLRAEYENGNVEVEGEWAFDLDWNPTDWKSPVTWSRHKLDVFLTEDETSGQMIDYKSGKKFGNEFKHQQQGVDYAISSFMRKPLLQFLRTAFWYIDTGETLTSSYTRQQAMALLPKLEARAKKLTSCLEFHPKPSQSNCKFCKHNPTGSGACEWAHE